MLSIRRCDGIVDCDDQSDEQVCEQKACATQTGGGGYQCDQRCWPYWTRCDQTPNCFDMSDELSTECPIIAKPFQWSVILPRSFNANNINSTRTFALGHYHFEPKHSCFRSYFDFKSARLVRAESLKYLPQPLADQIQETKNINYHLQLIYALAFVAALVLSLLALVSLLFVACLGKSCMRHCPYWFYGFFIILAWFACSIGCVTFLYQWYSDLHRALDPNTRLPIDNEILRLNSELLVLDQFGVSFWVAVAATGTSFLASLLSCVVCCRLPGSRHDDKEYKIMHVPSY